MVNLLEKEYEKINMMINNLTTVMRDGNHYYDKSLVLVERWVTITKRGITILEHSKPWHYTQVDVWNELEIIGVIEDYYVKCYLFLCDNKKAKNKCFGVPPELYLEILYQLMFNASNVWWDV